jgi:site-specific DNA recombinase
VAIAQLVPFAPPAGTAIYARISDDRKEGAGVARQLEDCWRTVKARGWEPAEVYHDDSISAYSGKKRPDYERLLADIRDGRVNRVVVWHGDRLHRRLRELLDLIELADERKVELASVTGGDIDLSTSDGRYIAKLLVATNEKSSEDMGRRIKRQKKQAREEGKMAGGPRPFGWKAVPAIDKTGQPMLKDGQPRMTWRADELDKVEAGIIRRAADEVFAGVSLAEIARRWNDKAVPQPQTGESRWTAQLVSQVLRNPSIAALVSFQGKVIREGNWPAILDRATWERCQAVLASRATNVGVPRRRTLLTKLVVCGRCGTPMVRASNGNTSVGYRTVWRCPTSNLPMRHSKTQARPCGGVSIAAQQLEDHVTEALFAYVDGADLAARVAALHAPDHEAADLTKELAALDQRLDEAAESYAKGKLPKRGFEKTAAIIENKRVELHARLARISQPSVMRPFAGRRGLLRRAWPQLTLEQKRAHIAEAFGTIKIAPAPVRGMPSFDHRRVTL